MFIERTDVEAETPILWPPDVKKVKSLNSVRLCNPMDLRQPGSTIHGIFQARILE